MYMAFADKKGGSIPVVELLFLRCAQLRIWTEKKYCTTGLQDSDLLRDMKI